MLRNGSQFYLTTRSANRACRRDADALRYDESRCSDGSDVLLRALIRKAPFPKFMPENEAFVTVFWIGSQGKNFGLHTDLYTDQFVVQNEGMKEVFLALPEDASLMAPFSFLESAKFYKSELRSVASLSFEQKASEVYKTFLRPGDVLYIPPFWWHEFCTVSDGPSLSTTFRILLPENKRFYTAVENLYELCKSAREKGSERLARHIASYFAYSLRPSVTRHREPPLRVVASSLSWLAVGFALGCLATSQYSQWRSSSQVALL